MKTYLRAIVNIIAFLSMPLWGGIVLFALMSYQAIWEGEHWQGIAVRESLMGERWLLVD